MVIKDANFNDALLGFAKAANEYTEELNSFSSKINVVEQLLWRLNINLPFKAIVKEDSTEEIWYLSWDKCQKSKSNKYRLLFGCENSTTKEVRVMPLAETPRDIRIACAPYLSQFLDAFRGFINEDKLKLKNIVI